MDISLAVFLTLLGIAVGSFLNVCIDRLPAGGSLVSPSSSYCDSCRRRLLTRDLVPIFSYLWLRGRCRYCGARIPRRVLLVEILTGAFFLLAFWRLGWSIGLIITLFWGCIFLVIIFIDWEQKLILNRITYPAAVVALLILAVDSLFPGIGLLKHLVLMPQPAILSGVIAGAIGFIFFLVVFLINPRGLGVGDIKLAGLIGLAAGLPLGIVALFIGIVAGGVVAVFLLLLRRRGRKDIMPYGTFLGLGPLVTMLWGQDIFNWYMGYF